MSGLTEGGKPSSSTYAGLTVAAAAGVGFQIVACGARAQQSSGYALAEAMAVCALLLFVGWFYFANVLARNARALRDLESQHGSGMWLSSRVPGMTAAVKKLTGGARKPSTMYAVRLGTDHLEFFMVPSGRTFLTVEYDRILRVDIGREAHAGSSSDALYVVMDLDGTELSLPFVLAPRDEPSSFRVQVPEQLRDSRRQLMDAIAATSRNGKV
ncbi:hypothetical protein [Agromyces aureus]|uniref:Uncharacterized protein n=1 Tax=Agromyces aureus TaxID=453304 RepID=A0A191WHG2_9MICO|nr:hypothetical protein [Agromyces aureus]ANJ27619.1 hypothetical protein ATC03_13785 [Agromyces aureus]